MLSWCAVRQGEAPLALRGAWAIGKMGKPLLAGYKRLLRSATSPLSTTSAGMGLAAIGLRHSRLYAEVCKALDAGPDLDREAYMGKKIHAISRLIRGILDPAMAPPEIMLQEQRGIGALACVKITARLPKGTPWRFERWEDVPEELAMTTAVNVPSDFMNNTDDMLPMFAILTWAARAAPEQLYLPADFLRAIHLPWTPELTLRLLRAHRDYYQRRVVPRQGPPRQGPCPCGSGKKYKRCCGGIEGPGESG